MNALNLIIKREYLSRIKKRSFVVLTLLMPVLMVAIIAVPLLLSDIQDSGIKRISVIDNTGKYASHLKSSEHYAFEIAGKEQNNHLKSEVGKDIFGILQITGDLAENPTAATFVSEKQIPLDLQGYINNTLSEVIKSDKINLLAQEANIDTKIIVDIRQVIETSGNIKVTTKRWSDDGSEKETSSSIAAGVGGIFTFIMYMFILMYGTMVMQGVVEEKSNRIVEVMISSVKPFDLMMGKIIGIGLTGITQLCIWFGILAIILGAKSTLFAEADMGGLSSQLAGIEMLFSINWAEIIISFLLLFIGGYLIYASLFAMFGAAVDNAQDTQQFVMPVTLIFIFSFYVGIYSLQNPDGPLAFWCSMIPLTSPIVMMVRIPFEIPLWEKILSIVILYTSVFFTVKFAAKIYRVGILMYGKKPSIKELIKWFSYK
ncbi:ABC-2 type transport system permease protein [Dysgonomonas alginatilytica]|uniref:ABC-2 type transport system permease protein n=1 Tax=Dysgonomonas alginatilytica TaxID=1605892 RepID=A0A2V3PS00_9BACT|nr:ABC transporter permease [Dysgonomonas alginatilytica]PXV67365.1 ABC-2 type transport system permease protein [Dysgonomonas alginatilytica]